MRPDTVCTSFVILSFAGVDHIHLLNIVVTVPVIVGEVYVFVGCLAGLYDHRCRVFVVVPFVPTIVRHVLRYSIRPHDVEGEIKLSTALIVEIVVYGAFEVAFVETLIVCYSREIGLVVGFFELLILKVNEDDDAFLHLVGVAA